MKKLLLFASMLLISFGLFAQETVTLTFTGKQQNEAYQQLDSVVVTNVSRGWTEVLYYPDTVLTMNTVGIPGWENEKGSVKLYQNVPNPFSGITDFKLMLLNKEKVDLVVFDINGKKVAEYHNTLPSGEHQFRATMSTPQTYLLSAVTKNGNTSIKMINLSNTGEQARIEYISSLPLTVDMTKKHTNYEFAAGDNMQYVGYATQNDGVKDVTITQTQQGDEEITFTFPTETFDPIVNVTTDSAGNIETTTATLYGHYSIQFATATEIGFEWKLTEGGEYAPVLASNNTAAFSTQLKALEANTNYTFKAFVKTADSTYYGEEKTFTTEKLKETTVTTGEATDINTRGATLHGSFTIGSEQLMGLTMSVKEKNGFGDWEDMGYAPATTSPFSVVIENQLEPGMTYLYKAKGTTMQGRDIYGEEKEFTTQEVSPEMPVVETGRANTSSYDDKAAQLNGKVVSAGYCTMSETGFYLGTTENPAKDGIKLVSADPNATDFTANTELLVPATTYYYVAFATNEVGTAYGEVKNFKTRAAKPLPEVVTIKVDAYSTSADVACEVVSSGETVEERGICYSTRENPDTTATKAVDGAPRVGAYTVTTGSLEENTTYYVRAYATSWAGIAYGEAIEFKTVSLSIPEVKTLTVDKVGSSAATVTSKLMVMGGSANLVVGIVCSDTVAEPTTENGLAFVGGPVGNDSTFVTKANELKSETKYYVRAYATNEAGTAYGEVLEFTTTKGFVCGDDLYDIEDNAYATVLIGVQCWMAENLRVKSLPDGTPLSKDFPTPASSYASSYQNGRYYYEREDETYGHLVLYPWSTANNRATGNSDQTALIQGICPEGWHVPSYRDYATMFALVDTMFTPGNEFVSSGTNIDSKNRLAIKLASPKAHWKFYQGPEYGAATESTIDDTPGKLWAEGQFDDPDWNTSGFSATPTGYYYRRSPGGYYPNGGAMLWTSIASTYSSSANFVVVPYNFAGIRHNAYSDSGLDFYGVRCLCDKEFRDPVKPVVATEETTDATASSATLKGRVKSEGFCEMLERGFYLGTTENPIEEGTKIVVDTNVNLFTYVLSDLEPSTTYYFAAFATNTMGTSYGDVLSFTTKEAASLAELQTKEITNLLATSLTVVCEVVNDGNEDVIERGVCYNTTGEPTVENTKLVDANVGIGEYAINVDGLESKATYHFRAYAITKKGNAYGNELVQEMPEGKLPTVKVDSIYDITKKAAKVAAQIVENGHLAITASGVAFDTLAEPTIEKNIVASGATEGAFIANLQKLEPNTKYYVRAYATNELGTAYSEEMTFTTDTGTAPFKKCGDILLDVDDNEYATVKIGGQCWMQENLKVLRYADETPLDSVWVYSSNATPFRYAKVTRPEIGGTQIYYTHFTATRSASQSEAAAYQNAEEGPQGICPDGWHVPAYAEWLTMFKVIDPTWNPSTTYYSANNWQQANDPTTQVVSENNLALRLANPEGEWRPYTNTNSASGFSGMGDVPTVGKVFPENSPGYTKYTMEDVTNAAWNTSGFNAIPCGYINKAAQNYQPDPGAEISLASSGIPVAWNFNGCLNVVVANSRGNGVTYLKIASDLTGVLRYECNNELPTGLSVRCVKDPEPEAPIVSANAASTVTASTAVLSGRVIANGRREITERGFLYSTDKAAVTEGTKVVAEGNDDAFTTTLTELPAKTTYFFVAYAVNEIGTGYSEVDSFTTQNDATLATVETKEATNLLATSVTIVSEVVKDGGELVTERGLCYATTANPDTTATVIKDGKAEVGEFTTNIADLTANTTYHFRAYAVTMMGVAYGNDLVVNMPAAELPEVNTDSVGNVGSSNAVVYAKLSSNGNQQLIALGAVVDTLPEPTKETGMVFTTAITEGFYTVTAKGLKPATKYYARAYAENATGVAYGAEVEFTTEEGFACGNKIYDVEGNDYATVQIGDKCWMKENMRTHTMPDGREMVALSTSVPSFTTATRYYYERTDTIVGHVVLYPWGTVNDITSGGQTNQDAEIQGICPDGWHVPTYKQLADMFNLLDPEWDRGNMSTSTGAYTLPSNNKLAVKLADPDCDWVSYGDNYANYNNPNWCTTENTLGYNRHNNIEDPDANISGFSARVSGYWKNGIYTYNGCLVLWTAVGSSTTGAARTVKIASDCTGIYHQSWSATAREGYAVRCQMNTAE